MKKIVIAAAVLVLGGCSSQRGIDPNTWSCESLIQPVIDMSKDKDVKILEITDPTKEPSIGQEIKCNARAELSNGGGFIDYGAHVSEGGQVIVEYSTK